MASSRLVKVNSNSFVSVLAAVGPASTQRSQMLVIGPKADPRTLHAAHIFSGAEMDALPDANFNHLPFDVREALVGARVRGEPWRSAADRHLNFVGAEELPEDLRRHATFHGMSGVVIWHGIGELQWCPLRIADGIGVAVRVAGQADEGVAALLGRGDVGRVGPEAGRGAGGTSSPGAAARSLWV